MASWPMFGCLPVLFVIFGWNNFFCFSPFAMLLDISYSPADRPCYIVIAIVPYCFYYYSPADRPCYIVIAIVPYFYYSLADRPCYIAIVLYFYYYSVQNLRTFPVVQINQIADGILGKGKDVGKCIHFSVKDKLFPRKLSWEHLPEIQICNQNTR